MRLCVSSVVVFAVLAGCETPPPELSTMVSPVISAQRRLSGDLQVILTYDLDKTPCGTVPNLTATFDGANVNASAGLYDPEVEDAAARCQFPGFILTPSRSTSPREIVFTDSISTFRLVADTLDVGLAVADSFPPTVRVGTQLKWLPTLPSQGTSSWKASFTPNGGGEQVWAEGTTLGAAQFVTVGPVLEPTQGEIGLVWRINSTVTRCEGGITCDVVVQGKAGVTGVVSP